MNETSRKCRHLKRLLNAQKPVTGEILDFALSLLPDPKQTGRKEDELWVDVARKLKAGEPLDGYGYHLLVDVILLHVRLQANAEERLENEG
jgi:hypothetical protein